MSSGFGRTVLFFIVFLIITISCTVFLKSYHKKHKKEDSNIKNYGIRLILTYCFSILISLFIVATFFVYCSNRNVNLKVNSKLFSDSYCTVHFFNKYNDDYTTIVYLPPNSVYCYKCPDIVYYNSNSIEKCVKSLATKLNLGKKEGKIVDFSYINNRYIIDCGNNRTINIDFKTEDSKTYLVISCFE